MAELSTIARPYAKAAFEVYSSNLAAGEQATQALADAVMADGIADLIGHPKVTDAELVSVIEGACGDALDAHGKNLLRVLVDNDRLAVSPALAVQFSDMKARAEARIDVDLIAAKPVSDDARDALVKALTDKLGRKVELTVTQDESLIGGAVIRAGDLVIDGSVKGQLGRITQQLAA